MKKYLILAMLALPIYAQEYIHETDAGYKLMAYNEQTATLDIQINLELLIGNIVTNQGKLTAKEINLLFNKELSIYDFLFEAFIIPEEQVEEDMIESIDIRRKTFIFIQNRIAESSNNGIIIETLPTGIRAEALISIVKYQSYAQLVMATDEIINSVRTDYFKYRGVTDDLRFK